MPRRQLHARGGKQVYEGIGVGRDGRVNRVQHLFVLAGPVTASTLGCAP